MDKGNHAFAAVPKIAMLINSIDVFNPGAKDASEKAARKLFAALVAGGEIDGGSLLRGRIVGLHEARVAADEFAAARVDLVVIVNVAFPNGHVFVHLATHPHLSKVPLAVVADPEPAKGGEWATNAWCGVIMNNYAARQIGRAIFPMVGPIGGKGFGESFRRLLRVAGTIKFLRRDYMVRFGDAPGGFHSATGNQLAVAATFGTQMDTVDLTAVMDAYRTGKVSGPLGSVSFSDADVRATAKAVAHGRKVSVGAAMLERGARLYHAYRAIVRANGYTSGAFRCWPEHNEPFIGVSACLAMSLLLSNGDLAAASCESDWPTAIVQGMATVLSARPGVCLDWVNHTGSCATVQLGHCGMGVCGEMCGAKGGRDEIGIHPVLRQVGKTMGPMYLGQFEYGPKTGICLMQDRDGRFKMLAFGGQSSPRTDKRLAYSAADIYVPQYAQLNRLIMEHGFPHHLAIAMSDVTAELEMICAALGVQYITPRD
jgi:L-fucose isomerase-like protein